MSRFRLIVLSMFGVMAIGAGAASTASAAFVLLEAACTGGTIVNLCWASTETGELKELEGTEEFTEKLDEGEALLLFKIGTTELHTTCTVAAGRGTFSQTAPLVTDFLVEKLVVEFSKCEVLEPFTATCESVEPMITKEIKGEPRLDEGALSEEAITFEPSTGTVFAEFKVKSKAGKTCLFNGMNEIIKGKQQCLWVLPLSDLLEHLLHCLHSESLLTLGEKVAEFEALFTILPKELGDFWDIESAA